MTYSLAMLILVICGVIVALFVIGLIICPEDIIADFKRPAKAGRYTFDRRMWGK